MRKKYMTLMEFYKEEQTHTFCGNPLFKKKKTNTKQTDKHLIRMSPIS